MLSEDKKLIAVLGASPYQGALQGFNRDGSNGMPYIRHLPNRTEPFLVMPIRQWDEQ